jgi:stage V sporulation protein SpoVS
MGIKVLKVAGDSNIKATAAAAIEEITQNMVVNIDCIGVKATYQTVKMIIEVTDKLVKMGYKFNLRPYYVKVDTLTQKHDTIPKTAIRWTIIAKKK